MILSLRHMGAAGPGSVGIDVYIDQTYVGELSLTNEEWDQLIAQSADNEIEVEVL